MAVLFALLPERQQQSAVALRQRIPWNLYISSAIVRSNLRQKTVFSDWANSLRKINRERYLYASTHGDREIAVNDYESGAGDTT
jgi:hypothetical protein